MTQDIALLRLQEAWRECQRHMHFISASFDDPLERRCLTRPRCPLSMMQ